MRTGHRISRLNMGWGSMPGAGRRTTMVLYGITFQFKLDDKGDRTLIGAGSYGWGPKYDGQPIRNYDGTWTNYSPHKNNMLDLYQLGLNSNTNVAIRGGNDKTSYYTSLVL